VPNIKSATKRARQSLVRQERNNARKNVMKTLAKRIAKLVVEKKAAEAEALLPQFYKAVDKSVSKNIIQKNNGARNKSRVTKLIAKAKKAA